MGYYKIYILDSDFVLQMLILGCNLCCVWRILSLNLCIKGIKVIPNLNIFFL